MVGDGFVRCPAKFCFIFESSSRHSCGLEMYDDLNLEPSVYRLLMFPGTELHMSEEILLCVVWSVGRKESPFWKTVTLLGASLCHTSACSVLVTVMCVHLTTSFCLICRNLCYFTLNHFITNPFHFPFLFQSRHDGDWLLA